MKNNQIVKKDLLKFLNYWPFFIFSIIIFLTCSVLYNRYTDNLFFSSSRIEVLDKSDDSEMALPTAMTIFNRSMINLDNEIGVLTSYNLHERVVSKLSSNVLYFTKGRLKDAKNHKSQWFDNYLLNIKIDTDTISSTNKFVFKFDNNSLEIQHFDSENNLVYSHSFDKLSTLDVKHELPFDFSVNFNNENNLNTFSSKEMYFHPFRSTVEKFRKLIEISKPNLNSDQLDISCKYNNSLIAVEYINNLISEFDNDGINDRRLEYKRTIDFVDSRSLNFKNDLELIELKKLQFKEENNLTDISNDASVSISQKFIYNSELFSAESQLDLAILLKESLDYSFNLMPINIGIENSEINQSISEYNDLVRERDRNLINAGPNNILIKSYEKQLNNFTESILESIENYENSLKLKIKNLNKKEQEFTELYNSIPESEKILRSIERELEIKESLYLLLLQKREEAAINFAVVQPSIKVVDYARTSINPIYPVKSNILIIGLSFGLIVPFVILFIKFYFDDKIYSREDILEVIKNTPIVGEIPFVKDDTVLKKITSARSKDYISESIRIIVANLNYVLFNKTNKSKNNVILVTSSIKGEGKTIVSINTASALSSKFKKVLLLGADLRNPQLHKFLNIKKDVGGLSEIIYKNDPNWKKYIITKNKLDILISGPIPPNPSELLCSQSFSNFINECKNSYDYIVVDSAPCLLVSDTIEIAKYVDTTLYVVRSNYTRANLIPFIQECIDQKKLSNVNIVINGVGSDIKYGYKYAYKYGYKYNYGYGYGYGSKDKD